MMIRYLGSAGMADPNRNDVAMAVELRSWIEAVPGWEMLAPTPFATLCFRYAPEGVDDLDRLNEGIMEEVNRSGEIFLSHTKLQGRYSIRVSIGNPRQTIHHIRRCWELLKKAVQ